MRKANPIACILAAALLIFTLTPQSIAYAATTSASSFEEQMQSLLGGMNPYFGNLHSHTSYSDGTGTPDSAFAWARDMVGFDFYAVTDHGEIISPAEWDDTGQKADLYNASGSFVTLRGFEWSSSSYGHIVTLNTGDYTNSSVTPDLNSFYGWLEARDAVAQFNHPGKQPNMFNGFAFDEGAAGYMRAVETGNKNDGNSGGLYYGAYLSALDKGWMLAPTDNQDNHSLTANSHRTVVVAPELTRTALLEALRERRAYSSDDPDMKVVFKCGGQWMGSVVQTIDTTPRFDVMVEDDENIERLELITNQGAVAAQKSFVVGEDSRNVSWSPSVEVEDGAYYFLRVTERDEHNDEGGLGVQVTLTAPIWIELSGKEWYLAEGCTAGGFETWALLQNPNASPARASLTFMTERGEEPGPTVTVNPRSRLSLNLGNYVNSFNLSVEVNSNEPLVVERSVYWNDRKGGSSSSGFTMPGNTWYLAEGCTAGGFETWALLQNPGEAPAVVTATFLTERGQVPGPILTVSPRSRLSLNLGNYVNSFNLSVEFISNQPVIVERSIYWNEKQGGSSSGGLTTPGNTWYLAEGCTDGGFETWVLIQNSGNTPAQANLAFLTERGQIPGPIVIVPPRSRMSLDLGNYVTSYNLSCEITSYQPVIVERAIYWRQRMEGSSSRGIASPCVTWYLAEGCTAGGFETWVLLQNPDDTPAQASLTLMTERGEEPGPILAVPPRSRVSLNMGNYVTSYDLSCEVTSDHPIVVERSIYWNEKQGGSCSGGVAAD
jgi:hypothetical protein